MKFIEDLEMTLFDWVTRSWHALVDPASRPTRLSLAGTAVGGTGSIWAAATAPTPEMSWVAIVIGVALASIAAWNRIRDGEMARIQKRAERAEQRADRAEDEVAHLRRKLIDLGESPSETLKPLPGEDTGEYIARGGKL